MGADEDAPEYVENNGADAESEILISNLKMY